MRTAGVIYGHCLQEAHKYSGSQSTEATVDVLIDDKDHNACSILNNFIEKYDYYLDFRTHIVVSRTMGLSEQMFPKKMGICSSKKKYTTELSDNEVAAIREVWINYWRLNHSDYMILIAKGGSIDYVVW
uniref:DUF3800 domain-containing protein n=1 Tax=Heterorhabditis bacteriophora TaxID=37862 RepID=A0A1I7WVX9_HETBA